MIRPRAALLALPFLLAGCAGDSPTPVETVTAAPVERVPEACLTALNLADTGFGIAGETIGLVPGLLDLIPQAYELGMTGSSGDALLGQLQAATAQVDEQTSRLEGMPERYNAAKTECREAAR